MKCLKIKTLINLIVWVFYLTEVKTLFFNYPQMKLIALLNAISSRRASQAAVFFTQNTQGRRLTQHWLYYSEQKTPIENEFRHWTTIIVNIKMVLHKNALCSQYNLLFWIKHGGLISKAREWGISQTEGSSPTLCYFFSDYHKWNKSCSWVWFI